MLRFRPVVMAILAGGLLAACGDGLSISTGPGGISIFGTYTLETVNGESLPFLAFQVGNDRLEIISGSVRLNSDATYTTSFIFEWSESGTVIPVTESGTYTVAGNTIVFTDSLGTFTGSISGNTLTVVDDDGATFVFRK
ncbi:MAG: hypothetical protein ACE5FP_02960 [Gemmatimonadota bacterium]